jgi:hypothetical protein
VNSLWICWLLVIEHRYDRGMFEDLSGAKLAVALADVDVGSLDADAALGDVLAAATDYELIAAITAVYLAEDVAA